MLEEKQTAGCGAKGPETTGESSGDATEGRCRDAQGEGRTGWEWETTENGQGRETLGVVTNRRATRRGQQTHPRQRMAASQLGKQKPDFRSHRLLQTTTQTTWTALLRLERNRGRLLFGGGRKEEFHGWIRQGQDPKRSVGKRTRTG